MNYNEAYKTLITAVNEYVDSNPLNPIDIPVHRYEDYFEVIENFSFRGIEYLESDIIPFNETTPQYIKDIFGPDITGHYFISKDKSIKYKLAFGNILSQGLTYSATGATGVDTYTLSSVETVLHLCEAIQNGFITLSPFSIYSSVETYLKAFEVGDAFDDTRDERLFLPSIDKLSNLVDHYRLVDKGVVESGDWSMILNLIKDIEKWAEIEGVDPKVFMRNIIDNVLDRGFVFTQNETEVMISSVETYTLPFIAA